MSDMWIEQMPAVIAPERVQAHQRLVVPAFDFLFEHLNDNLGLDGLSFVDGQPPVILEEIREFEFGDAQHVRFERLAN